MNSEDLKDYLDGLKFAAATLHDAKLGVDKRRDGRAHGPTSAARSGTNRDRLSLRWP